jgi:hypothetical protein
MRHRLTSSAGDPRIARVDAGDSLPRLRKRARRPRQTLRRLRPHAERNHRARARRRFAPRARAGRRRRPATTLQAIRRSTAATYKRRETPRRAASARVARRRSARSERRPLSIGALLANTDRTARDSVVAARARTTASAIGGATALRPSRVGCCHSRGPVRERYTRISTVCRPTDLSTSLMGGELPDHFRRRRDRSGRSVFGEDWPKADWRRLKCWTRRRTSALLRLVLSSPCFGVRDV